MCWMVTIDQIHVVVSQYMFFFIHLVFGTTITPNVHWCTHRTATFKLPNEHDFDDSPMYRQFWKNYGYFECQIFQFLQTFNIVAHQMLKMIKKEKEKNEKTNRVNPLFRQSAYIFSVHSHMNVQYVYKCSVYQCKMCACFLLRKCMSISIFFRSIAKHKVSIQVT